MSFSQALLGITLSMILSGSACVAAQNADSSSNISIQQAQALAHQGHLDAAKTMLLALLQKTPTADSYNLLGIIQSEQQDYTDALVAFHNALQLAPQSTQAHNNLGNVYLTEKNLDLAEKEFRMVLRMDPNNQDANYNLGLLLMMKKSPAEAIAHFDRIHPRNLETSFSLIRAYLQTNQTAEALRLASQLSTQHADDVQLHFSLGVLLASESQYKAAQLELEKAEALQPGTYEILFNLGQASLRNGNNQGAELALSQALKLKPDSADTLYLLAQVYNNESRSLDALDLLVKANKLAPDNPDILYLMAQISISQKYYEDATPLLEKALQIAPGRPDLLSLLGESYFKSDKIDKSISVFKQLIEIQPSVRAYSFLGLSYTYLGRFNEARESFERGLKLDPHNSFCQFQLGYIARMQGDSAAAEAIFLKVLRTNPDYPIALLELANIRIEQKQFAQAAELLRKYVHVSSDPATGYYKLAMVEKNMRETSAAERDLAQFQTLSKNAPIASHPYDHLFDYLDDRSKLAPQMKTQKDLTDLTEQLKLHPNQPEVLYALAEAYLKSGNIEEARNTIELFDKSRPGDARTLTQSGVLLARYALYDDAIQHFLAALQAGPHVDDVSFDLANAYYRKGRYSDALDAALQISPQGRKDDSYLVLLGDIYARLGDASRATELYQSAILRNPDNDQNYLSLALLDFRKNDISAAKQTLLKGYARIPGSGKLAWGLGLAAALNGDTLEATRLLQRAVDILPEWSGAYSTLGIFYYQTGQISKAKEVLDRFENSNVRGGLDVHRIEEALAQTPSAPSTANQPLSDTQKNQLLQVALLLADRTL